MLTVNKTIVTTIIIIITSLSPHQEMLLSIQSHPVA